MTAPLLFVTGIRWGQRNMAMLSLTRSIRMYLWRQADTLRLAHRSGAGDFAGAIALSRFPDGADAAGCLLPSRSASSLFFRQYTLANTRRRPELEADQPGSDTQDLRITP